MEEWKRRREPEEKVNSEKAKVEAKEKAEKERQLNFMQMIDEQLTK